jgi:hypothetical protein
MSAASLRQGVFDYHVRDRTDLLESDEAAAKGHGDSSPASVHGADHIQDIGDHHAFTR